MALIVEPVSIEPMRWVDVERIAAIERRCYPTPWHANAYYTELNNACAVYLVARVAGEVVGYGGMWVVMDEAHITTLAVDPPHQGRKIGERLLHALLEEAILRGAQRATLEVREYNQVAQNLYRKYGFREAAMRRSYYSDNGENAIVMWAEGIAEPDYLRRLRELRRALNQAHEARDGNRDELR